MEIAKLVLEYFKVLVWPAFAAGLLWILREKIKETVDRLTRVETPAGSAEFAAAAANVLDEAEEVALSSRSNDEPNQLPGPVETGVGPGEDQRPEEEQSAPVGATNGSLPVPDSRAATDEVQRSTDRSRWREHVDVSRSLIYDPSVVNAAIERILAAAASTSTAVRGDAFGEALGTADVSPRAAIIEAWLVLQSMCRDVLQKHDLAPPNNHDPRLTEMALRRLGLPPSALSILRQLRELRNRAVHSGESVSRAAAEDFVRSCRAIARELKTLAQ